MFKSLRNQFLILNMTITSLVIVGAFAIVYISTWTNMNTENQSKLDSMSGAARTIQYSMEQDEAASSDESASSALSQQKGHSVRSEYLPAFILQFDADDEFFGVESFLDLPDEVYEQAAELAENSGKETKVSLYDREWLYKSSPYAVNIISNGVSTTQVSDGSYQVVFLDITDSQKTLRDLLVTLILVTLGMLIVVFFISLFYSNRSIRPISGMWEKQKQFVTDASHELKTPLAIVTSNYDALLANQDETIRSQREWLDYIKIGTDRMSRLISSMLLLSRVEDAQQELETSAFDVSAAVSEEIQAFQAMTAEKEISLTQAIEPEIIMNSSAELVRQLFSILYENAIKYTEQGGHIEVALAPSGKLVACTVKNSGAGIAPEDLDRVFDRFYRADPAHCGENSGYGLGLSIARTIVDRLGGTIAAESESNGWTRFSFTAPLNMG